MASAFQGNSVQGSAFQGGIPVALSAAVSCAASTVAAALTLAVALSGSVAGAPAVTGACSVAHPLSGVIYSAAWLAGATGLHLDSFDVVGDLNDWKQSAANGAGGAVDPTSLSVGGGALNTSFATQGQALSPYLFTNGTIRAVFRDITAAGDRFGVVGRYGGTQALLVQVGADKASLEILEWYGGAWVQLGASVAVTFSAGLNTLDIEMEGTEVEAYLNSAEIMTRTTRVTTIGFSGVRVASTNANPRRSVVAFMSDSAPETVVGVTKWLDGAAVGTSIVTAELLHPVTLTGAITGGASVSAETSVTKSLDGAPSGSSSVPDAALSITKWLPGLFPLGQSGFLQADAFQVRSLTIHMAGDATVVTGGAGVTKWLDGAAIGSSSATAELLLEVTLSGAAVGAASVAGSASLTVTLSGAAAGSSATNEAPLDLVKQLGGDVAGSSALSTPTPDLEKLLGGSLSGTSAVLAAATVTRLLDGAVYGHAHAAAELSIFMPPARLRPTLAGAALRPTLAGSSLQITDATGRIP